MLGILLFKNLPQKHILLNKVIPLVPARLFLALVMSHSIVFVKITSVNFIGFAKTKLWIASEIKLDKKKGLKYVRMLQNVIVILIRFIFIHIFYTLC